MRSTWLSPKKANFAFMLTRSWTAFLPGRGACATLDGAANVARSLLREFPAEVEGHVRDRCGQCAELDFTPRTPPFAVAAYAETLEETAP